MEQKLPRNKTPHGADNLNWAFHSLLKSLRFLLNVIVYEVISLPMCGILCFCRCEQDSKNYRHLGAVKKFYSVCWLTVLQSRVAGTWKSEIIRTQRASHKSVGLTETSGDNDTEVNRNRKEQTGNTGETHGLHAKRKETRQGQEVKQKVRNFKVR